jgi:predicted DNA-binding WGR domain protein
MSSLYHGRVVALDGPIVRFQLTIVHPDISEFGTDRFFAWKLLAEWVSPPDDDDELTMAARYVKRVEVSPLENGTVAETLPTFFRVKRKGKKDPRVTYTIEVTDPAILESMNVGDADEFSFYVEPDKVVPESGRGRRFEFKADGSSKFWEALLQGCDLHIRWGRIGTDGQSQIKSFPTTLKAQSEHDKLVAEKVKKGYAEVGGGDAPAAVQAPKPAAKKAVGKGAESPSPKTFDDLRNTTLELLRGKAAGGSWVDPFIGYILVWSHEATDEQVMAWLDRLPAPKKGWLSNGAGLVAVQRVLAGKADSAKRFLAVAESTLPKDPEGRLTALEGLLPARWRLGKEDDANKAFASTRAELFQNLGEARQQQALCGMAALGGQKELVEKLITDYGDPLLLAIPALVADGFEKPLAKCLKSWNAEASDGEWDLSRALVRELLRRDQADRYLELVIASPLLLGYWDHIAVAFVALEKKEPKKAAVLAERLLDGGDDVRDATRFRAVALLTAHAPARAEAWAKKNAKLLDKKKGGLERYVWLAALGRTEEARGGIKEIVASDDRDAVGHLAWLGAVTNDRALAIEALKAHVDRSPSYDDVDTVLVQLVDLGERAFVDELLDKRLAEIEKSAPKDRDHECRKLCKSAGMTGRHDLGLAAYALPTKSKRPYVAKEWVRGCALVGDWTSALTALELDPDDDSNGRVSTAIQGLRVALDAPFDGPRAVPLRALRDSGR